MVPCGRRAGQRALGHDLSQGSLNLSTVTCNPNACLQLPTDASVPFCFGGSALFRATYYRTSLAYITTSRDKHKLTVQPLQSNTLLHHVQLPRSTSAYRTAYAMTERATDTLRLLDLPPELRLMVYEHLLSK
jgi:hypothetical protein